MKSLLFFTLILLTGEDLAQQPVENFILTNVADNSILSLNDQSSEVLVVIFTSNGCAFDNYYTARIKSLSEAYAGRIQFLLINSYIEPAESAEAMAVKYKSWGLSIPYLADKIQVAMNSFHVRKSPEAFLLKKTEGKYIIVYSGALDDNPQVASDVKQNYLKESIDKVLSGKNIEVQAMRAAGCSIRRK